MEKKYRLWDAHVHMFPERLFRAIWGWFEENGVPMPYKGLDCEELTGRLKNMGVERAFLLIYAHKPDVSAEINSWGARFCQDNPFYLPFGCVHPGDSNLGGVMEDALDRHGLLGFKIHYMVCGMRADDPGFTPVYRALESRGKILVAHAGTAPLPKPWLGLEIFERVLDSHPGMLVQLAHLGHFELDRVARLMRKYPNLYLDTAWAMGNSVFQVDLGAVRDLIMEFPERIVYGSDFPIIMEDPRLTVEKIINLSLPGDITEAVFWGNAERLVAHLMKGDMFKWK